MKTPERTTVIKTDKQVLRVAFYDRNRVDPDTPISVIELQNALFYRLLKKHPEWENAGIYRDIDEFGTTSCNQLEFNKLMEDCKRGMIDLVVVKSISKFSRNIVDLISMVSAFHSMNPAVELYFINENIDTRKDNDLAPFEYMHNHITESEERTRTIKESLRARYLPGTFDHKGIKKKSKKHRKHKKEASNESF